MKKYYLSDPLSVIVGNQYCLYLAPWNTTTDSYADDYRDLHWKNANVYGDGNAIVNSGGTWAISDSGNLDMNFETYACLNSILSTSTSTSTTSSTSTTTSSTTTSSSTTQSTSTSSSTTTTTLPSDTTLQTDQFSASFVDATTTSTSTTVSTSTSSTTTSSSTTISTTTSQSTSTSSSTTTLVYLKIKMKKRPYKEKAGIVDP